MLIKNPCGQALPRNTADDKGDNTSRVTEIKYDMHALNHEYYPKFVEQNS